MRVDRRVEPEPFTVLPVSAELPVPLLLKLEAAGFDDEKPGAAKGPHSGVNVHRGADLDSLCVISRNCVVHKMGPRRGLLIDGSCVGGKLDCH